MKEIEITIAPDGTVSAVIAGVKGPACKVLAQELAGQRAVFLCGVELLNVSLVFALKVVDDFIGSIRIFLVEIVCDLK